MNLPSLRSEAKDILNLSREFDAVGRHLDDIFRSFGISPFKDIESADFIPRMDTFVKDKTFYVECELPGIAVEDVNLTCENNILSISGKKLTKKEDKKHYTLERTYGSFMRELRVPDNFDASKVEAVFENGILTVSIPEFPEVKNKEQANKIEIKKIEKKE